MQITYVTETHPPEINGVSLSAARTVAYLRAAGHAVHLVRPRQPGEAPLDDVDEWRTAGGPIPMYPSLRYGLARIGRLRRRLRGEGAQSVPHLLHVATPGPLAWAALHAARAEGIATSADFRTNFHAYSRHYGLGWMAPAVLGYLRRLHALADTTFVPTAELADRLAAQGFERLQVVGRGVDCGQFSPAHRDAGLRSRWRAGENDTVLLYVGRLAREKNVALALATFERLRLDRPGLRMVVVGDGPQRAALQRAHPQAHFAGVLSGGELARHYASADVFLFPSLTETFGNVTLEAMASGLAVVAFDTAAAAQHLDDGRSGWLAPPSLGAAGDVAFLAAARRALVTSAGCGSFVRQQALRAAQRADWDSVLRGFEQRLRGLAGAPAQGYGHAAMA